MTIRKLASEIAKREGKKSQARIGDIREILSILGEIMFQEHLDDEDGYLCTLANIYENGKKRAMKGKKK